VVKRLIDNRTLAIVHDMSMIPVAWLGAYWLRFNLGAIPAEMLWPALWNLGIVILVQVSAFR
jgi:hypothetical protein